MMKFLLICLIVIIIVVSIAVALHLYERNIVEKNREAVINDLKEIADRALEFYSAPIQIGGGDNSWVPLVDGEYMINRCALWLNYLDMIKGNRGDEFLTENGTYKLWLSSYDDKNLKILGTGIETGKDGVNPVQVQLNVNGPTRGVSIIIIN